MRRPFVFILFFVLAYRLVLANALRFSVRMTSANSGRAFVKFLLRTLYIFIDQ